MNTKIVKKQPKPRKFWIIFSLILMGSSITLFFIYKFSISKLDYYLTKVLQNFILFVYDKDELNKLPILFKFTNCINSVVFLIIILIVVYNYLNIYKTFILYNLICFGYYLSIFFKLLFSHISEKPSDPDRNEDLKFIMYCCDGFGLPSTQLFLFSLFFFCLFKIINENKKYVMKNIYLYIFIFFICLVAIDNIIKAQNYFSQIAFSFFFALSIYILIFNGFNIKMFNGNQFYKIIIKNFYYCLLVIFLLIVLLFLNFIFVIYLNKGNRNKLFGDDDDYEHRFNICLDLEYIDPNRRFLNLYSNNYKINFLGSIIYFGFFLSSIVSLISVKLDYYFIFNKNKTNFLIYNFNSNEITEVVSLRTSLTTDSSNSINIIRDCKWNNTSKLKSFIRLLVIILLSSICFLPYFLVHWYSDFVYVFFIKIMLSSFLFSFGIFFWFKPILNKLNLNNLVIFDTIYDENNNDE